MIGTLDFRICSDSVRAARASFAALSQAVAVAPLSDALAERLQALAPGAQAAAGLLRFSYEAFRHGAVTVIEARLTPGDPYLDFIAALVAETPGLQVRHEQGWPILSLRDPMVTIGMAADGQEYPPATDAALIGAVIATTLRAVRERQIRRLRG